MVTIDNLDPWLDYHAPDATDIAKYQSLREAAKLFSRLILSTTPVCADQQAALRKVKEALMTANSAIATKGQG